MRKDIYLVLVSLFLVILSSGALALPCNSNYNNSVDIGIPARAGGYADGNTIQVSIDYTTLAGIQADLDDVLVYDVNNNCALIPRSPDGTSSSTDGNLFYFLDNPISNNTDSNGDYKMYYGYSSETAQTDLNFSELEVCNNEDGSTCAFTNADNNNTEALFGFRSMHVGNFSGSVTAARSADTFVDKNYSTWFWADDSNLSFAFSFVTSSSGNNRCRGGISDGNFYLASGGVKRTLPNELVHSSGVGYAPAGTWYKIDIREDEGNVPGFADINCSFTFSDTSGNVLMIASAFEDQQAATPAIDQVFVQTSSGSVLVDNLTYGIPYSAGVSIETPNELRLKFYDENKGYALTSLTITFDGNTYTPGPDGNVTIPTYDLNGTQILTAYEDNNYTVRTFEFDVNVTMGNIDLNLFMLNDVNGQVVLYKLYDTDQTTLLTNRLVRVLHDENLSEMRYTDASGETAFYLDPDDNYIFEIVKAQNDVIRYYPTILTVNIPKDEDTLTNITPFGISESGLGSGFIYGTSTAQTYMILANTVNYYIFDINASGYQSRTYSYNVKGNPATDTLQPYLTNTTGGLEVTFYTLSAYDNSVVPNILLEIYKTISGEGSVLVNSIRTDSAGIAIVNFVEDDEYDILIYDSNNNYLFTETLRPTTSPYYIYIDTEDTNWTGTTKEYIKISGLPNTGYVDYNASGYTFNVEIDVNSGTISTSWFTIDTNADQNITYNTSCGSACSYTVPEGQLKNAKVITITVFVETASGLKLRKTWQYIPLDVRGEHLILTLQSGEFKQQFGCSADPNSPCFFLIMVSLLLTIAILFAAGVGLTTDMNALSILAVIVLGLFTYLTWIPTVFFILACIGTFGAFVMAWRSY